MISCNKKRTSKAITESKKSELLSRRYQLEFCSSSLNKNGGSGGNIVALEFLARELASYQGLNGSYYNKIFNVNDNPNLWNFKPYAIIDADFQNEKSVNDKIRNLKLDKNVEKLKRYEIENYIFDPVLISQFSDLTNKINYSSLMENNKIFNEKDLNANDLDNLKLNFENFFKLFIEQLVDTYEKKIKEFYSLNGISKEDLNSKLIGDKQTVSYINNIDDQIFELEYPKVLLNFKFKEIEKKYNDLYRNKLRQSLISNLNKNLDKKIWLSKDIKEIFYKINAKIRDDVQANKIKLSQNTSKLSERMDPTIF